MKIIRARNVNAEFAVVAVFSVIRGSGRICQSLVRIKLIIDKVVCVAGKISRSNFKRLAFNGNIRREVNRVVVFFLLLIKLSSVLVARFLVVERVLRRLNAALNVDKLRSLTALGNEVESSLTLRFVGERKTESAV